MTELDLFIRAYKLLDWKRKHDYKSLLKTTTQLADASLTYVLRTMEAKP